MDELIKYIINDWKKAFATIIVIFFPAFFFVFMFNRDLFKSLEPTKLILLTVGIAVFIMVFNFILISIAIMPMSLVGCNMDLDNKLTGSWISSNIELIILLIAKRFYVKLSTDCAIFLILCIAIVLALSIFIKSVYFRIRDRKVTDENRNE